MILIVIMIICFAYYALIVSYAGSPPSFSWFWLVAGALCGVAYVVMQLVRRGILVHRPPLWITVSGWTTFGVVVILTVLIEALVIIGMFSRTAPSDLDYLIVLGTDINGDQPSASLRYRLDKAIEYLQEDEDLKVIVSGGQLNGNEFSEAYVMARYLLDQGISSRRIIMENEASSTRENLIFSYEMMEEDARVGVVTNSFHVFRATSLAKKLGFDTAVGIAAPSDKILLPNQMVRELFVIIKEKIMGYI